MNNAMEKIKSCKTPAELLALAKENGLSMTEAQAAEQFGRLQSGELADEELDNVNGGASGCHGVGQDVILLGDLACPTCGSKEAHIPDATLQSLLDDRVMIRYYFVCRSCGCEYNQVIHANNGAFFTPA